MRLPHSSTPHPIIMNTVLKENEVHIYKTKLNKPEAEIKKLQQLLSEDELQRSQRYKLKHLTDNYIVARGILRKVLGSYLDLSPSSLKISYKDKGKPFLEGSDLKFNLSHSNDIAVYAFTLTDEVGIDVEQVREVSDALQIARRFFSLDEYITLKEIDEVNTNLTFFNCWTRKESFIKAIGEGLSYPLEYFSVTLKPGDLPGMTWIRNKDLEANQWSMHNIEIESNYVSSLSIKNKNKKIIYCKGF